MQSQVQGVERAFKKTKMSLKKNDNYVFVLFFDEIGMADQSRNKPLKTLKKLLDDYCLIPKGKILFYFKFQGDLDKNYIENVIENLIGFVSLSNWRLDLSVMSRCAYVIRPDPSQTVLEHTAKQLITKKYLKTNDIEESEMEEWIKDRINMESKRISKVYFDFRKETNIISKVVLLWLVIFRMILIRSNICLIIETFFV